MTCSCKKPSPGDLAATSPVAPPRAPAFLPAGTAQLRPGIVRTAGVAPHKQLVPQLRDMDGTDLTDAENLPQSQWPEVREPVLADGSSYASSSSSGDSSGVVVFTDPARVSAYNSPLGQALERLAQIFTGSTTP